MMNLLTYLLISTLSLTLLVSGSVSPVPSFSPFDSQDFCSQIITPTCNTTFSYIDSLNEQIRPHLKELVKTPYFRFFKLDFDKQCKFWNAQHFCATRNCAVEILPSDQYNWSNIEEFSPSKLGEIQRDDPDIDEAGTCEDLDYCHIDDGHNCVYVDLVSNPERFTGYGGNQSLDVWKAIYSENCFPNTNPMSMSGDHSEPEQCVEKNLFYRLISGLHASIGVHLSNEYLSPEAVNDIDTDDEDDYSHQLEQRFEPNLKIFMERVGSFNDRLSNIYFNYALISQLIVKLSEIFDGGLADRISCGEGELQSNLKLQIQLLDNEEPDYKRVFGSIVPELTSHTLFNTSKLFDPTVVSPQLKNEFRQRFKNVSSIMDCVGCDRCRMWGKLQTIGYGTALKILFESDDQNQPALKFRRIELVALFNTFDRISKSVEAINNFKQMYLEHLEDVKLGKAQLGEYEKQRENIKGGFNFPFLAEPAKSKSAAPSSKESKKEKKSASGSSPASTAKPKKKMIKATTSGNSTTFAEDFKSAFDEVMEATYFVLSSYRSFFPTIWKVFIVYLDSWWNQFIGRQPHPAKYDSPLQEDYNDLFE